MSDNSQNNKRIAKNTIYLSIRMVIVLAVKLFTTRIVLQGLGVVDYGVYNVVCGFVTLFAFLNTSMSNGVQRFFNYEYGKNGAEGANKVYCTSLYIQATLAIIIVIVIESLGLWYLDNKMVIPTERVVAAEWIFQLAIFSLVLGIMEAPFSAAVTAHEKMDFYAIISVIISLLKFGIALSLLYINSDRLILYGILMALISLFELATYYIYCKKHFEEICFRPIFDKQMFKSMLGFSGWNMFGSLSGVMVNQGINLVINFFYGPIVNAARGVAIQVNGAVQSFVSNISIPVRPQVTQSYARGDLSRTMSLTYSISKLSNAIVLLLALPASLEIDFLLKLWLGDIVPPHTNYFTIIILMTSLVTNLNWATSGVVHATGIMRDYQVWGSLVKIGSVPVSFLLIKSFGYPEIALLTVFACEIIAHTIGLFIVRKLVGMSIMNYFESIVIPIIIVLAIALCILCPIRYYMDEGFLRLIVISLLSLIIIILSVYYICFDQHERVMINGLVKSSFYKLKKK